MGEKYSFFLFIFGTEFDKRNEIKTSPPKGEIKYRNNRNSYGYGMGFCGIAIASVGEGEGD